MDERAGETPLELEGALATPAGASVTDDVAAVPPLPLAKSLRWKDLALALAVIWGVNFAIQLLAGFAIGIYAAIDHVDFLSLFMQPKVLLPLTLAGWIVGIVMAWYCACARGGASAREGFAVRPVSWRVLAAAAMLGLFGAIVAGAIGTRVHGSHSVMSKLVVVHTENGHNRPSLLMFGFALLAPVFEEIYYRGFVFTALSKLASTWTAFVVVSIWFGLIHAFQLAGDWVFLFWVACMGVLWSVLRVRYNSIAPSMTCHWVYNASLVGAGVVGWLFSS